MRVISGKHKGKSLIMPKTDKVRPTADIVKQALFTKLQFDISGMVVLDLFAGSGSLGIEAVSRNAKKVVFVDIDTSLVKSNLQKLDESAEIIKSDYAKYLQTTKQKFDLILIDPPYASGYYSNALDLIKQYNILNENGIIVCEHLATDTIQQTQFEMFDQKKYGIKKLSFYK